MFDVIHLHETAVARRERGIFANGVAKDGDRPLPAFRIEFRHQVLSTKPAVVDIERNIGLTGKPHQPFRRQLHVKRGRDAADDALLRLEPVIEAEPKTFAPDIDARRFVPQHHHHVDFGTRLIRRRFNAVLRGRIRRRQRDRRWRTIDHAPFAETHQTRRKMQVEPLHKVGIIASDAMHLERSQHKADFGRCFHIRRGQRLSLVKTSIACSQRSLAGCAESINLGERLFEGPEFNSGDEFLGRR